MYWYTLQLTQSFFVQPWPKGCDQLFWVVFNRWGTLRMKNTGLLSSLYLFVVLYTGLYSWLHNSLCIRNIFRLVDAPSEHTSMILSFLCSILSIASHTISKRCSALLVVVGKWAYGKRKPVNTPRTMSTSMCVVMAGCWLVAAEHSIKVSNLVNIFHVNKSYLFGFMLVNHQTLLHSGGSRGVLGVLWNPPFSPSVVHIHISFAQHTLRFFLRIPSLLSLMCVHVPGAPSSFFSSEVYSDTDCSCTLLRQQASLTRDYTWHAGEDNMACRNCTFPGRQGDYMLQCGWSGGNHVFWGPLCLMQVAHSLHCPTQRCMRRGFLNESSIQRVKLAWTSSG